MNEIQLYVCPHCDGECCHVCNEEGLVSLQHNSSDILSCRCSTCDRFAVETMSISDTYIPVERRSMSMAGEFTLRFEDEPTLKELF